MESSTPALKRTERKDEDEVMSSSGDSADDRNGKQNEHMRTTGGASDYTRKKDVTTSQQFTA